MTFVITPVQNLQLHVQTELLHYTSSVTNDANSRLYAGLGLRRGYFFEKERWGKDQLVVADPAQRGAQLSLRVAGGRDRGRELFEYLMSVGVVGDWREPDVIRISPAPLYNRYMDVHRFVEEVETWRGF